MMENIVYSFFTGMMFSTFQHPDDDNYLHFNYLKREEKENLNDTVY